MSCFCKANLSKIVIPFIFFVAFCAVISGAPLEFPSPNACTPPPWFTDLRNFLEILYFLSGIALVVVAIIALQQIKVAKEDIRIRSEREAATLTASQCERYSEKIIPILEELIELFESNSITPYNGATSGVSVDRDMRDWITKYNPAITRKTTGISSKHGTIKEHMICVLNAFESFSIYFSKKVCDESLAFDCIASTYCFMVKACFPILMELRGNDGLFENTLTLYNTWTQRKDAQDLRKEAESHLEMAALCASKAASIPEQPLTPIGTNLTSNSKGKPTKSHHRPKGQ